MVQRYETLSRRTIRLSPNSYAESLAESGGIRALASFLCGMGPQGEDLLKQLVVRDGTALLKAGHQRSRQVMRDGTAGEL